MIQTGWHIAHFAPVIDNPECASTNEGSIPFTRSNPRKHHR
jgi:hypothetical protein